MSEVVATGESHRSSDPANNTALPPVAWDVAEGHPLLALVYALDFLKAKREAPSEAA